MSKKTKKEKILAAYRKKLRLLEQFKGSNITPLQTVNIQKEKDDKETVEVEKIEQISPPKYFFTDLRKSLILVFIIIALEISLYFAKLIK